MEFDVESGNEPLSDEELERLDRFLHDEDAAYDRMPTIAVEGLIAGILSGPNVIVPSRWFPSVFGTSDASAWDADIAKMLLRFHNEIAAMLASGEFAPAIVIEGDSGDTAAAAAIWAAGYSEALILDNEAWDEIVGTDAAPHLRVIFDLLDTLPGSPRGRFKVKAAEKLVDSLNDAVIAIWRFWRIKAGLLRREPIRNTKKVGRNEPCSCGSGRKFKTCCGAS